MPTPPLAARKPHSATHHGLVREDPYDWLRAENWQEVMQNPQALDPEIRAYLDAENAFYEDAFGTPTAALQERIYREIRGRIKEEDSEIPLPDGPFAYSSRTEDGKQYPILVRTPREGGPETVLLDCNLEAGEDYFGFGGADHDPSHRFLAWAADRAGSEFFTLQVREIATGQELPDRLERVAGGAVWSADSQHLFYGELDDNHRPYRIRRHRLGTAQSEDETVYEETDPGFFVGVGKTLSGRFIEINAHDHETSEVYLIDADTLDTPRLVAARQIEREYDVEERDGQLIIRTNADSAEDFKIVAVPLDAPGPENWVDLVPYREGVLIISSMVLRDHLLRLERVEGLPRIVVLDFETGREEIIRFEEEAYALGMSSGYEFDTDTAFITYASPTTPFRTLSLNLRTGERIVLKEQIVPSGHDPADYVTRRIMAEAPDGETVPVTLLHRATTALDGTAPCLLYGYGAYGHAMTASFSVSVLSLVDRGFVFAVAHVRGGTDKGYRWYKAGKREYKANTFSDFISAAETLVARKFVAPDGIVAQGGSAGGMLMGAIANLRPDLFAGIIAEVPFVDVLNTMLDESLPLTPPEWPEWGNPITSEADYRLIESYAPYEQVSAQAYPPILALAGLTDPRVTYWEPAKWVAKLRATKLGDAPLYLRTNMGAGHGGASGRFDRIKETAIAYAFALRCVNLDETSSKA